MKSFDINELVKAIGGTILTWNNEKMVKSIGTHTDRTGTGSLCFPLNGYQNSDDLFSKMLKSNAGGIVISAPNNFDIEKWTAAGIGVINVTDVTEAYVASAAFYRSLFNIPFIEVIGSSGKTTTKEIIGAVIKAKMPVLVSFENYNAPMGVIYNILKLEEHHKAAVLEVGMQAAGVMAASSKIIKPDIAVVTCIHRAHLSRMGSIENIIAAKSEILQHISPDGTLIINGEDENCMKFPLNLFGGEVLKFGFHENFDIWASDIRCDSVNTFFKAHTKEVEIDCKINTFGKYNVSNALAAIMVGLKIGMNPNEISEGLAGFKPFYSRQQILKGIKGTVLVDDTFNANPDCTRLLIENIPDFAKERPVVLIIGDMENPNEKFEEYARREHFIIGQAIANVPNLFLVAIGKWAKEYLNGALSDGFSENNAAYFKNIQEAKEQIPGFIIPGSVVILKSSTYVPLRELLSTLKVQ